MSLPTCETCIFWKPDTAYRFGRTGACRKHAPTAPPAAADPFGEMALWPKTFEMDGCGDHQAAEAKP